MMRYISQNKILILCLALTLYIIPNSFIKQANSAGVELPFSFHLEHPYSITGFKINGEIFDLEDADALYLSEIRADVNINKNKASIYTRIPFVGITEFPTEDGEENEYDVGNIAIGVKSILLANNTAVFTGGIEAIIPTVDDELGAMAARVFFRDLSSFVDDAFTIKPYAVFGVGKDIFAFQANFGADIITNADEIEDDNTELILKYGGTASVTPHLPVPFGTAFLVELLVASSTSFDENRTEAFLTPGLRFGGQIFSVGAGVEIPLGQDTDDFVDGVGFLLDLIIRFGS